MIKLSLTAGTLAAVLSLIAPLNVWSETLQRLNSRQSENRVSLQSNAVDLSGTISSYNGTLKLNLEDLTRSEVELSFDIRSLNIPAPPSLFSISILTLLQNIPDSIVHFKSTNFSHIEGDKYSIQGVALQGRSPQKTSFPVRILQATISHSIFALEFKKNITSANPLGEMLAGGSGSVTAKLHFQSNSNGS